MSFTLSVAVPTHFFIDHGVVTKISEQLQTVIPKISSSNYSDWQRKKAHSCETVKKQNKTQVYKLFQEVNLLFLNHK